jgi:GGDEF domain-containing protein
MIEDKDVKIAESTDEAKWEGIKLRASKGIEENKTEIEINQAIVNLAEEKLKEMKKGRGKYIG